MDYFIDEKNHGRTVLWVMRQELRISRTHLKHLKFIEDGIRVNGEHATVRRILNRGDILTLAIEDCGEDESVVPVRLDIDIAYEDGDCIVPSKPADMPTHPSHGHYCDTVANALAYISEKRGESFVFRPVNRLDRNTSGLLLIAKNRIAAGVLSRAMAEGKIKKAYLAILKGEIPEDSGYIETYMRRTAESIIVRENCEKDEGGDYALTKYARILSADGHTLVAARPITGRTHQLRVHFAGLGAPILGDDMYGEPSLLIDRHALHSTVLSFPRVSDGEETVVVSRLPKDMRGAVASIFGEAAVSEQIYLKCRELLLDTK